MSTIDDIANDVIVDKLHRVTNAQLSTGVGTLTGDIDIQDVARRSTVSFYEVLCANIPFDELQVLSPQFTLVPSTLTYSIAQPGAPLSPTTFIFNPVLRAIQNIQIQYDALIPTFQGLRLRRSAARVYDSLATTPPGRTATYSRFDNNLLFNPPPQNAFTITVRYWFMPTVGLFPFKVTNATQSGSVATYTLATQNPSVGNIQAGDIVDVSGVNPIGFNVRGAQVVTAGPTVLVLAMANSPGVYASGGVVVDRTAQWLTPIVIPSEWEDLMRWEVYYRCLLALQQWDAARELIMPAQQQMMPGSPRKQRMYHLGIIPRLWNDLLATRSQKENVDEDFNINPIIRNYSVR